MKRLFIIIAMILCVLPQLLAEHLCLVVQMKDSSIQVYDVEGGMSVSWDAENILLSSQRVSAELPRRNVSGYHFSSSAEVDRIDALKADNVFSFTSLSEATYLVKGLTPNAIIDVYSVNGTQVSQCRADDEGSCVVNLFSQPSGVYVISCGTAIKVVR